MSRQFKIALAVILGVLAADQIIKIYVKTHFYMGEEYSFAPWFKIHFTENAGMAFGYEFGGAWGKLLLSLFRIGAAAFGVWYLRDIIKKRMHPGYVAAIGFIFAGAVGNIIDSLFYGLFFSDSNMGPALFMPPEGGYESFLHGRVVDMFYFPIAEGKFPSWLPFWGNDHFVFFRPVFNLADASITTGVLMILIWQRKFFKADELKAADPVSESQDPATNA